MPQVTIDTSANIEDAKAVTIIGAASNVLAKAAGVPTEHVHINLKRNQLMTWGSKLGGVDGNPHTAQVRIVVSQALTAANKQAIVTGVGKLLAQHAPPASTQFYFVTAAVEDLAIDGLLLPDLIARDASTPAAAAAPAKESKGAAQQAKQTPEEKKAKEAAKDAEKLRLKIIKEGGKKGVEIEGASDMGGLDFFCTTMELPDGDLELLELAMLAMNAEPDPGAEDRKGCSGHIGKMIYSAGVEQLAIVAYVPDKEHNKSAEKVDVTKWMDDVCEKVGAEVTKKATVVQSLVPNKNTGDLFGGTTGTLSGQIVVAVAKSNPDTGKFALKDKDAAMAAAFAYLRTVGAFPEDEGDDSDDMVFGDDSNFDDYS